MDIFLGVLALVAALFLVFKVVKRKKSSGTGASYPGGGGGTGGGGDTDGDLTDERPN